MSDEGTTLIIGGSGSAVQADRVNVNSGATLRMAGGSLQIIEEAGDGLLDVNFEGTLSGYGSIFIDDLPAAVDELLSNDGTLTASHPSPTPGGEPIADTLAITASGNARIDLDGLAGGGVVNVHRNQTLDVNGTLADPIGGLINLFQNSKLDISTPWSVDLGTIVVDNGAEDNPAPTPDVPAGKATIAGGALTLAGGTINVVDADGVLQFDAPLTMTSGALANSGTVIFNANATVADTAILSLNAPGASLTVGAGRTVTVNQATFNLDGPESGASRIAVNAGGQLNLNLGDYDSDTPTNVFNGTMALNGGVARLAVGSATFVMAGTLEFAGGYFASTKAVDVRGAVNVLAGTDSTIEVQGSGLLDFEAASASTLVGNLRLASANARIAAGAAFTGAGTLVVPVGGVVAADAGADVGVRMLVHGALHPGGAGTMGRMDVKEFQQSFAGRLSVDIAGAGSNQFDRIVVAGSATVGGLLAINIAGGFTPTLGATFDIITAQLLAGQFSQVDVAGMPAGLQFRLNYLPAAVQLQVVAKPIFSADFDDDGDVDPTDFDIWKGAFDLNQLGDADGDNDSDGFDFLLWQQQFGAKPAVAVVDAVPEPASGALAVLATMMASRRLRSRLGALDEREVASRALRI